MKELTSCRSVERARAKINLSLEVLDPRPDGYHELAGLMSTIDLADRLHLSVAPAEPGTAWQVTSNSEQVPAGPSNLCYRAAELFFQAVDLPAETVSFFCHIDKTIPQAAGLGGGSADAAAVLRFLWRVWQEARAQGSVRKKESAPDLDGIARSLGADVPFCLHGGIRFCQGIGEKMSDPIRGLSYPLLLAVPPVAVPTPDAFRRLDRIRAERGEGGGRRPTADCDRWAEAFARESIREIGDMTVNDFVPVLSDQVEALGPLLESMRRAGSFACSMTGSGPSCFALFEHREQRDEAHRKLARDFPGIRWFATALSCQAESLPC